MSEYIVEVNDNPTIKLDGWNVRCDDLFIQREEIVRCKDCKFCHKNYCEKRISSTVSPSEIFWIPVEPDGYCKWGEKVNE